LIISIDTFSSGHLTILESIFLREILVGQQGLIKLALHTHIK